MKKNANRAEKISIVNEHLAMVNLTAAATSIQMIWG